MSFVVVVHSIQSSYTRRPVREYEKKKFTNHFTDNKDLRPDSPWLLSLCDLFYRIKPTQSMATRFFFFD